MSQNDLGAPCCVVSPIKNLIYMYDFVLNIGSSAPDWPGTVQKHADTSTALKKQVNRLIGRRKAWIRGFLPQNTILVSTI